MKIKYQFTDETVEIEVDEEWGNIIVDLDREEYNNNHRRDRHCYSLDSILYEGEEYGEEDPAIETFGDPDELDLLAKGLSVLNDNQLAVIRMHYFEKKPFSQIGEILGISKAAAHAINSRAVAQLKKYFSLPR